jgi:uncharacterized protein DUF6702
MVVGCLILCLMPPLHVMHPLHSMHPLRAMHPLHTTMSTLTYDRAAGAITLTMRTFASDVSAAAAKRRAAPDAYVRSMVALTDQSGTPVPLTGCGTRTAGDVMWICVTASAPRGPAGMSLSDRALFDLFDDQVNIVGVDYDGRRETMLFTKTDPPRRLP